MDNNSDFKNPTKDGQGEAEVNAQPFFSEEHIQVLLQKLKNNPSKLDRNLLLDLIRATAPITIYKLHKLTGFAYTSIKAAVREFEFCGLIYSVTKINENNQAYKSYYITEEEKSNG